LSSARVSVRGYPRTGKNGQHGIVGLYRQSTFGRLGGYEDVNDADRLGHDPATAFNVNLTGVDCAPEALEATARQWIAGAAPST
jgi:hypothetical protein